MADSARSYFHRTSSVQLLNDTLGGALDKASERWPDREAVVVRDQDVRLSFAALRREVDRLAAGLIALGLAPGDRVGLWSPNRIEWVLTQYATAKAGLILVNINPSYRAAELKYALNKVECRALITADRFKTTNYIEIIRSLAPELAHCPPGALRAARLPHLTTVIHFADTDEPGVYNFAAIQDLGGRTEHARLDELSLLIQPDDPVNIQFTSGTTGSPKAATLTHHGLLNNGYFFGVMAGAVEGDRVCATLPLYHVGAMVLSSICGIALGGTVIYLGEAFDPLAALETIQEEKCNWFGGVPTMLIAVLNHPAFNGFDLSKSARRSLRRLAGAERCHAARQGRDEHAGDVQCLRHDRTLRRQRANGVDRYDGTPADDDRPRAAAYGGPNCRSRRPHGPAGHSGRALLSWLYGDARLLE